MGHGSWQSIGVARRVDTKAARPRPVREIDKRKPSTQPRSRNRCTKAAINWLHAEGEAAPRTPIVGSFAGWACVTSGHATPPPTKVMNSRRLIDAPGAWYQSAPELWKGSSRRPSMSALGHKRTFRSAIAMSALPPKPIFGSVSGMSADIRLRSFVCAGEPFMIHYAKSTMSVR
jgi:hypothetical protein